MNNPFKGELAKAFDDTVEAYRGKSPLLFNKDGTPNLGNSFSATFWGGYNGLNRGLYRYTTAADKKTLGYAMYRAGQGCKANQPV